VPRRLPLLLAAGLVPGCDADDEKRKDRPRTPSSLIRDWVEANNRGDYTRAARFFAPGAVVEQTQEIRLPDRAAAERFNRSLSCRASLTRAEDEKGTTLATFRLRRAPAAPARVR